MLYRVCATLVLVSLSLAGCSSFAMMGDRNLGGSSFYVRRIGEVTPLDLDRFLPLILANEGYMIQYVERKGTRIEMYTHWRDRAPFADEASRGVHYAQTRLIIHAEWQERLYSVRVEAENRVRTEHDQKWYPAGMTRMFREYADRLTSLLRRGLTYGTHWY